MLVKGVNSNLPSCPLISKLNLFPNGLKFCDLDLNKFVDNQEKIIQELDKKCLITYKI